MNIQKNGKNPNSSFYLPHCVRILNLAVPPAWLRRSLYPWMIFRWMIFSRYRTFPCLSSYVPCLRSLFVVLVSRPCTLSPVSAPCLPSFISWLNHDVGHKYSGHRKYILVPLNCNKSCHRHSRCMFFFIF